MNSCLKHSIAVYDKDKNLEKVHYISNTIFSLECAKHGYKYKTDDGTVFHTSEFNIEHDLESDLNANVHYRAYKKTTTYVCGEEVRNYPGYGRTHCVPNEMDDQGFSTLAECVEGCNNTCIKDRAPCGGSQKCCTPGRICKNFPPGTSSMQCM